MTTSTKNSRRQTLLCLVLIFASIVLSAARGHASVSAVYAARVEQWGAEEVTLHSRSKYDNSFVDVKLTGTFTNGKQSVTVSGFYDGGETWRVRFMPPSKGLWHFLVSADDSVLNGARGSFLVTAPRRGNHGPVRPANTYHFSYADQTPLFVLGTTIYNWINRDEKLQEQTLWTLSHSPFNKVRFFIFPKWFVYNRVEPKYFPYVRRSDNQFDFDRFDVRFFHLLESRIIQLQRLGIEADIILFHPYDHWGFEAMGQARDDQYLRYVAARLSAYRNIWWTMANEYDLFNPSLSEGKRPTKDWNHLGTVLAASDPYHHLIGVHDIATWYDADKPWVTHVVDQDGTHHPDIAVPVGRAVFRKPVLVDEYGYEGNNGEGWGDFDARSIVKQHWELTMAGGYGSHGETYVHPGGVLWWSDGGSLVGDSVPRLAFLKSIMTSAPFQTLELSPDLVMGGTALTRRSAFSLFYFEHGGPVQLKLEGSGIYKAELIDPWQMKVYSMGYVGSGVHAINIHMIPCVLRFVREPALTSRMAVTSLRARMDRFAGEMITASPETPFRSPEAYITPQYTLNLLLLIPAAREAIRKVLPDLPLDGISPALTLQEILDNPKYKFDSKQATAITEALSHIKAY